MTASTSTPYGATSEETATVTGDDQIQALVTALDDERCREILRLTTDDYCTASDISDACDMPLSTTYRKLDLLTDAGLLTERTKIHRSGNHATAYTQQLDSLVLDITDTGDVEVTISYERGPDELAAPGHS